MKLTLDVTALVSDEAAVVEIAGGTYHMAGTQIRGEGWAKTHPNDTPNPEIGYSTALVRALRALADRYEDRAVALMESDKTGYPAFHPGGLVVSNDALQRWTTPSFLSNTFIPAETEN